MVTSASFGLNPTEQPRCHRRASGFSLVEVALAIGIVAFALVPMLGLMATGQATFQSAMNTSVGAQIAQHVANDLQQTDFATLTAATSSGNTSNGTSPYIYQWPTATGTSPVRYFDNQAHEYFAPFTSSNPPPIYQVQVRINPVLTMPYTSAGTVAASTATQLLSATIQVATNPANATMAADPTTLLWTNTASVITSSSIIANNGEK